MTGALEYAQARMQARHGARPAQSTWIALHAATTLAAALDIARAGALSKWVSGIDAGMDLDSIELRLRERLRERIAEASDWMPDEWRPALLWTARLIDLPAMQRLAAGRGALSWMESDPQVAALARVAESNEALALDPRRWWLGLWRSLWPAAAGENVQAIEEVVGAIERHLGAFARAEPADAATLREALRGRIEALFRRHTLTPAAAFAWVALVALDAERLRAEVVAHALRRAPDAA